MLRMHPWLVTEYLVSCRVNVCLFENTSFADVSAFMTLEQATIRLPVDRHSVQPVKSAPIPQITILLDVPTVRRVRDAFSSLCMCMCVRILFVRSRAYVCGHVYVCAGV